MNTTPSGIPPSESKRSRRSKPLALAGDIRDQRRNRNQLLRALNKFSRECLREARLAAQVSEQLGRLDVQALAEGAPDVRKALASAIAFDYSLCGAGEVSAAVRSLIGAQNDWVAEQVIRFKRDRHQVEVADADTGRLDVGEPKRFTAEAVLADAARIVAGASDADLDEIDWTENPKTERERALRAAIISRIEIENGKIGRLRSDGTSASALHVLWGLENLAPIDAPVIGRDLYEAIKTWEALKDDEDKRNAQITKRRLLDQARRDVDGKG